MARYAYKKTYAWSPNLAYIVGLIASDGSLSKDGRHISFTSKDEQLAVTYRDLIDPGGLIARKSSGSQTEKIYYYVQFSNTSLYDFLLTTGMTPNKSLTLPELKIPTEFFADFLRGEFDGDGCVYGYQDRRWRSSYMFYTTFCSASLIFVEWLQSTISSHIKGIVGGTIQTSTRAYYLSYAKRDSILIFRFMYYQPDVPRLTRKYQRYLELFKTNKYAYRS